MVNGELREDVQYYHRICALTIVSSAFPIPLGVRFQKNGETEVACTLSLLQDLLDRVGRRFLDLLVADALYLQTPFVRAVEDLGLDWVINLKDNQPELLAEAQRLLFPNARGVAVSGRRKQRNRFRPRNNPYHTHTTWRVSNCRTIMF